jgi:diguanylate cyclase (GGDEF)-like protein
MNDLQSDLLTKSERRRIERVQRWGLPLTVLLDTLFTVGISLALGLLLGLVLRFDRSGMIMTLFFSFLIPFCLRPFFAYRTTSLILKLHGAEQSMTELARTDQLTGAYSKTYFKALVSEELARDIGSTESHAVIFFDIDSFKEVNDRFGHMAGDNALQQLGKAIQGRIRAGDVFGRFGGDEFMLFLPHHTQQSALVIAERLRQTIADLDIVYNDASIALTVSMGITTVDQHNLNELDALLERADKGLLHSKSGGGNQVYLINISNGEK